ncbi:MAG TPA: menaquinone biosynthesis protein [Methylomirabilota bacterium]|nr:menaquinone biosynthesis protein [Methylomirabilota bacterium]
MHRVATVSYLNARPLVEGLESEPDVTIVRQVPSRLLATLESGEADLALCPVIDVQQSRTELEIVPCGAIACDGPALTVRLFSRVEAAGVHRVAVDGDSHTSAALLRILLADLCPEPPAVVPFEGGADLADLDAVLLIGDKVVTAPPDPAAFPHQLDLGEAWKELTGRPFVFAAWLTRAGARLGDLPDRLDRLRRANRSRLAAIARRHAAAVGWPEALAERYLTHNLRYELGPPQLEAIDAFWRRCHQLDIIHHLRPMKLHGSFIS